MVQALLSIFVESSTGDKRKDSEGARRFIEEQIKAYEKKLEEAENRLKEFKLKHMGLMGDGKDYFAKMSALSEELAKARLELRAAEQSRDALKREVSGRGSGDCCPIHGSSPRRRFGRAPRRRSTVRIESLKKSLDDMLRPLHGRAPRRRQHPAHDRAARAGEAAGARGQEEGARRGEGAVRRRRRCRLPRTRSSSSSRSRWRRLKRTSRRSARESASWTARYRQLQAAAKMLPEMEAQFAQLNRDYEVQKRNYEGLVSRRESAAHHDRAGCHGRSRVPDHRSADGFSDAGRAEPDASASARPARLAWGGRLRQLRFEPDISNVP